MKFGIDIDNTISAYPEFFNEFIHLFGNVGHEVYIITGLGYEEGKRRADKYIKFPYTRLITTKEYNDFERSLLGRGLANEIIVGIFKQRFCKELGINIMFDDQADIHNSVMLRENKVPVFKIV